MKALVILLGGCVALIVVMLMPVGGGAVTERAIETSPGPDLSAFSFDPPRKSLRMLFIHHSCGGQWMADPGPEVGELCIYETYPEGGALRSALEGVGYEVHEASYGSVIGEDTDIFHWPEKFRTKMDRVLVTDHQDQTYDDARRNQIVAFKSCYPNNYFFDDADEDVAGNPAGPALTIPNAQAAYNELLPEFRKHPAVLFVCVTAPPFAAWDLAEPMWKKLARKVTGKASKADKMLDSGERARRFNNWLKSPEGWLKDYPLDNVVVFDLFDVLTDEGASNFSRYPTGAGDDSHPARAGSEKATAVFLPFLNRAVRRLGLAGQ